MGWWSAAPSIKLRGWGQGRPSTFSKFVHYKGPKDAPGSKGWELVENNIRNKQGPGLKFVIALISICLAVILLLIIVVNITSRGTLYYLDYELYSLVKGVVNPTGAKLMTHIIEYFDKYIIWGLPGTFLIYLLLKKEWWTILALFLSVGG